jgi:hypothetical protein
MMKHSCLLLAIAALLATTAVAQEVVEGTPKLVIPTKIQDLGTVAQGQTVDADFKLRNEGDVPLVIKAVRPTCGCTVADFDKEIAPGGEGWVRSKLDTTGFSGPISKSILVVTNDPQLPTMSVIIKAKVQPFVEVIPRPLVRFNAVQRDGAEQVLTVVGAEGESFEITEVTSSEPFIETTVRKLDETELFPGKSKDQYQVALRLADTAPVGQVNAEVSILTNHAKAKKLSVKVFGIVRSVLHVTPSQMQFGSIEAAVQPGRNVIVVNNRPSGEVEVTEASVDDPAFETQVFAIEKGKRYQITVTVKPEASSGPHDAELRILTTDTEHSELRVPVRANIR